MTVDERSHKENNWTCHLCTANYDQDRHIDINSSINEAAGGMLTTTRNSLRLLQWNADGLKSKSNELADRLHASDIDIAIVQET